MKRAYLVLLLGIAGCGPAFAQASVTAVSPALGLEDFRRPIACTGRNLCAKPSPALGLGRYSQPNPAGRNDGAAALPRLLLSAALLPGPTPRPAPTDTSSHPDSLHDLPFR